MSSSTPPVAVVVPTHQRPELLRLAIDSILAQDYDGDIDVIVVFDKAEPDLSLERRSPHRSVRVITNCRTPGLPGARNTGIDACPDAALVAFCDDDDMWMPAKLSRQVELLEFRPDAVLCTTGIEIDYDDERSARPSPNDELTLTALLRHRLTEAHPSTFLARREALDEVGSVDEVIPGGYSEDYDYLIRLAKIGAIVCVAEPLVVVRWGRTSFFSARWRMIVDAQRYLLDKHPEFADDRRADARIHGQIAFALAALGERRAAFREIASTIRRWPLEKRWPVAAAVAARIVSADRALALAHGAGRGI